MSTRPGATADFASSAGVALYTFPMKGGERPSRNASIRCRVRTKLWASSARRRLPHQNEQRHLEALDCLQLVRDIPNTAVVGDGYPPGRAAMLQPLFIAALGLEQVAVPLDDDPGISEDARKLLSEIAVGEVDPAHAARA